MEPGVAPGKGGSDAAVPGDRDTADDASNPPPFSPFTAVEGWTPGVPSVMELLPSLIFGAALPIGIYFAVRSHVHTDAEALIVAGSFSVLWILIQFVRQRRVDFVGVIVLVGFVVGVGSSTLLGGNSYVLKVRDAFFTALFGIACIVTIYTAKRPAIFYVGRYLSAGSDPTKVAAYNDMHDLPTGRRTFRVLSVLWGIGLVIEAVSRMVLAEELHTGTYLAVSPVVTATVIGSLFAFTVVYSKRATLEATALMTATVEMAEVPVPDDVDPTPRSAAAESIEPFVGGDEPPLTID
jgi:hypothetical protein